MSREKSSLEKKVMVEQARKFPESVRLKSSVWKTATAYAVAAMIGFATVTADYSKSEGISFGGGVAYAEQSLASKLNNDGIRLYRQKKYVKAEEKFREAINADRSYADAYSMLGSAFLKQNKIEEAINAGKYAIKLDYNNPTKHFKLGKTYLVGGYKEQALDEFNKAKSIARENNDLSSKREQIYNKYIEKVLQ
ncbi:MAG: tetratricopeptide repeat protein [Nanoarchaeota archaeon]|nr:tetratricopeptide repeat protein [Nanoarchaeota archaeon]